jgi:hypothetical protein
MHPKILHNKKKLSTFFLYDRFNSNNVHIVNSHNIIKILKYFGILNIINSSPSFFNIIQCKAIIILFFNFF